MALFSYTSTLRRVLVVHVIEGELMRVVHDPLRGDGTGAAAPRVEVLADGADFIVGVDGDAVLILLARRDLALEGEGARG